MSPSRTIISDLSLRSVSESRHFEDSKSDLASDTRFRERAICMAV